MPNWCSNFVQITHEDPAMIERAVKAYQEGKFLNEFIPMPQELLKGEGWYGWAVSNWGTKWDVGGYGEFIEQPDANTIELRFDSAWSPPIEAYGELVKQGFTVDAMYYEPGMGFCGRWVNGDDDYYEISGMNSNEVAEEIDPDIDQQFCISENMAQWEQEAKES